MNRIFKTHTIKLILYLILLNSKSSCNANIIVPPLDLYLDPHSLGMGGAFVAVANDENAIFTNAAGIGSTDRRERAKSLIKSASFPNITGATNAYSAGLLEYYFNSNTKYPSKEVEKSVQSAGPNDIVFSRASLFPTVVINRVQLGFLADTLVSGYTTTYNPPQTSAYSTTANPLTYDRTFSILSRTQVGPCAGFSIPINNSNTTIGIGTRYLDRATLIANIEANESGFIRASSEEAGKSINRTTGAAFDFGILIPFQGNLNFKIAASAIDIGDSTFQPTDSSSRKEVEKMNVSTGMSINPSIGKESGLILSAEAERINDQRVNDRDKLRVGSELSFGSYNNNDAFFSIRVGYAMRTVSAGLTLRTIFARLEFSTYGEAVQTNNGIVSDRRYAFRLTVDLNK